MTATELVAFMGHVFHANFAAEARGLPKTPLCIWGTHGIGKTETVESVARHNGWRWAYVAPAQFEEMGDFLGMPRVDGEGRTAFAPPEWVPREEGPGILLIDDMNRADGRILRGIMQLLQRHETMSWKLPRGWQIVATANPEGGDYAVSALDPAMLTRMLHATLVFDVKAWAAWADEAGIDPRGIAFVSAYPELGAFSSELGHLARTGSDVWVVYCDAAVQRQEPFRGALPDRVPGGGGTAFDPALRAANEQRPDGIVCLTDGFGPRVTERVRCPLLWVLTRAGADPAAAETRELLPGRIVRMH